MRLCCSSCLEKFEISLISKFEFQLVNILLGYHTVFIWMQRLATNESESNGVKKSRKKCKGMYFQRSNVNPFREKFQNV